MNCNSKKTVLGLTHVDLAWKKGRKEMAELYDVFILRLLDILDHDPSFTYLLEQVQHLKDLSDRRPDLFERIKKYILSGRVEVACGMASSIETNIPDGECFVRNMQIGLRWLQKNLKTTPMYCTLIDTFGFNAQIPQILQQFGVTRLFANRFGSIQTDDVFFARGLDQSRILVAGRDVSCPSVRKGHVSFVFYNNWNYIDNQFQKTENEPLQMPHAVLAYTENEVTPSIRIAEHVHKLKNHDYEFGTLKEFFENLESQHENIKEILCDLNPEFTGTFSLRIELRIKNRQAEDLLLNAEKWNALLMPKDKKIFLEDDWWEMAYLQSHDLISGSHPTKVYFDCMNRFASIESHARESIVKSLLFSGSGFRSPKSGNTENSFLIINSLPWDREEILEFPVGPNSGFEISVLSGKQKIPFHRENNTVKAKIAVPAMSAETIVLNPIHSPEETWEKLSGHFIENEFIRLEFGNGFLVKKLVLKSNEKVLLKNCNDLLILQEDDGNFQIESPTGSAVPAGAYEFHATLKSDDLGQYLLLAGAFPPMPWNNISEKTPWTLSFFLPYGKPYLDVNVKVDWHQERSRLRFQLSSCLGATKNYYDIPFGVIRRSPYRERATAKGEWPARRFVAMENGISGISLANRGTVGVEVTDGILTTTILRAPSAEYAGMIPDETSSDHGEHSFAFRIIPYDADLGHSGTLRIAQELNSPVMVVPGMKGSVSSRCRISPDNIVLSAIKAAEDQSGDLILRVYESVGEKTETCIQFPQCDRAWESNMLEKRGDLLNVENNALKITLNAYEIKTVRIKMKVTVS